MFLLALVGGSVWGFYAFVPEHWVGWFIAVMVGWAVGLPVVTTLVNRGLYQPKWPPPPPWWRGKED